MIEIKEKHPEEIPQHTLQIKEEPFAWTEDVIDGEVVGKLKALGLLGSAFYYSAVPHQFLGRLKEKGLPYSDIPIINVCGYDASQERIVQVGEAQRSIARHVSHHAKEFLRQYSIGDGKPAQSLVVVYNANALTAAGDWQGNGIEHPETKMLKENTTPQDVIKAIIVIKLPEIDIDLDDLHDGRFDPDEEYY